MTDDPTAEFILALAKFAAAEKQVSKTTTSSSQGHETTSSTITKGIDHDHELVTSDVGWDFNRESIRGIRIKCKTCPLDVIVGDIEY